MTTTEDGLISELNALRIALAAPGPFRAAPRFADVDRSLARMSESLTRPLRMAVLGEGNSGKSLFINYLLKHQVLPSGGFSGESTQLLIRYAPEPSVCAVNADGIRNRLTSKAFGRLVKPEMRGPVFTPTVIYDAHSAKAHEPKLQPHASDLIFAPPSRTQSHAKLIEIGLPLPLLKRVEIIEVRAYPEGAESSPSTRAFRNVDLTLWCTLATQAWKETEVVTWKRIPALHRETALMLVTYKDAIRSDRDESRILARLRDACTGLFDDVVLVSLRDALQSLLLTDAEAARTLRADSNVEAAEFAINAMIHGWERRRFEKAANFLRDLAQAYEHFDRTWGGTSNRELIVRLERLAAHLFNASPSIFLADQAA